MPNKNDSDNYKVEAIQPKQGIWRTYDATDGLLPGAVSRILQDRRGCLWIATAFKGLCRYDGVEFTAYTTADGLAHNYVLSICEDQRGRLWFGTYGGASCFDGERFTTYTTEDGLAHNRVFAICEDQRGRLWFGTYGGASRFDGERFTIYTTADGLAHNYVWTIYEDQRGRIWFGFQVRGGGVFCYDGHHFTTYTTEDSLLDNRVTDILHDREGHLWFGTWSGLTRFDPETLRFYTNETVHETLIQDREGRLWFNDSNALYCIFHGQQRRKNFKSIIHSFLEDATGAFWVATSSDGIYRYDSLDAVWCETGTHFTINEGLPTNSILHLLEARDGTIWVGTTEGPLVVGWLCYFNGQTFEGSMPTPHAAVFRLLEDSQGRFWMGGFSGGLSCYDGEKLVTYTVADGLPHDSVVSIVEDDKGKLWIGTWNGLCSFDGRHFIAYGKEIGLTNSLHQWSARDQSGRLWFGTTGDGLYRYNGKHFQQLTTDDGLPSNSITGFVPQSDGSMIIGTIRGLVHYRPTAKMPPGIEIREVVTDQIYQCPKELEITETAARLLTISYRGLSLATQKMRYSYLLEGYDNQWRDTWESYVRYENLSVGEYTFKVIAINRDLVESESPAILKLTIVPDPRDQQIAALESELARRNRELEAELQDAHNVQMSLIPETAPEIEGVEIAGKCLPANTVSGDFFDYLEGKHPHEIALVVADVMGKAMKGAMNAMMTSGLLRMAAKGQEQLSPSSLLMEVNDVLKARTERLMNVAMVIGVIDAANKILTIANAGILPLLLRDGKVLTLKLGDLPLGMITGIAYTEEQFPLQSNDVVILMTDGIIEIQNSDEQFYSESGRLEETIRTFTLNMSAEAMIDTIIADAINFGGDKDTRDDDMTIVVAKLL